MYDEPTCVLQVGFFGNLFCMKRSIILPFVIVEAVLYIVFMTMDVLAYGGSTIALKYIGILLCVAFSIYCAFRGGERIIPFALIFTAIADVFLLVIGNYFILGLLFFLVVQSIYLYYLYRKTGRIWIPVRIVCLAAAVAIVCATGLRSGENLLAGIYFSMILINMIMSWTYGKNVRRLFAIGLTLFVCCDICVGLYNLYWMLPDGLYAFTRIGMWMFYLPSQVLIALSMVKREGRE